MGKDFITLKTLANNGKVKSFKTSGEHRRFRQDDLDTYMGVEKEKEMQRKTGVFDTKTGNEITVMDCLSRIAALERERDGLQIEIFGLKSALRNQMQCVGELKELLHHAQADNALLRKQIEEIEESRDEWRRQWYLSEAGLSAAEKEVERLRKRLEPVPEYLPDVNANEQCMELKEGR